MTDFRKGDKVRRVHEGIVEEVNCLSSDAVQFLDDRGNLRLASPDDLELVERPVPQLKPGTIVREDSQWVRYLIRPDRVPLAIGCHGLHARLLQSHRPRR